MVDFMYGPIEDDGRRFDFEPLEFDDEEDEEAFACDDESDVDADDEYEEPGLAGWDDLRPFGSFDDGYGWDETL